MASNYPTREVEVISTQLSVRSGAKTGIVTSIARFGSNLGLNVQLHMLAPDSAYTFEHARPRFHPIPAPSDFVSLVN